MSISILEVIISLTLLSLVMLGVSASNVYSIHASQASYYIAAATQQINNLDDYIQTAHGADTDSVIQTWKLQTQQMLPQGLGELRGTYPSYHISVYWGGENNNTCPHTKAGKKGCLSRQH